jgi:hypothetical protein
LVDTLQVARLPIIAQHFAERPGGDCDDRGGHVVLHADRDGRRSLRRKLAECEPNLGYLGGELAVLQTPIFDGLSLDFFSLLEDGARPARRRPLFEVSANAEPQPRITVLGKSCFSGSHSQCHPTVSEGQCSEVHYELFCGDKRENAPISITLGSQKTAEMRHMCRWDMFSGGRGRRFESSLPDQFLLPACAAAKGLRKLACGGCSDDLIQKPTSHGEPLFTLIRKG